MFEVTRALEEPAEGGLDSVEEEEEVSEARQKDPQRG